MVHTFRKDLCFLDEPHLFVNHRFKEVQAFLDEGLKQTASLQQMEPLCGAQSEMRKRKKRSTE